MDAAHLKIPCEISSHFHSLCVIPKTNLVVFLYVSDNRLVCVKGFSPYGMVCLQFYLLEKKICTMKRVLCALPKNKTPLLIIACCSILLEESSFQKHPKSPFNQPSKILQFSLTEYLIPYFTLAFRYVQNGKLSIFPKTPPIVILNAYCMVGMPPFPLVVCWPCPYMQHVSIFTWQRRIMQPIHLINPQTVYGIVSFKCEAHRVLFFFGMVSSPSKVTSSL